MALPGVYLLWAHQRSTGKRSSTTRGTQPPRRRCSVHLPPALHLFSTVSTFVWGQHDHVSLDTLQVCAGDCGHRTQIICQADLQGNLLQHG